MSAGAFSTVGKYQSDDGSVHPVRVQPETITAWNPNPAGAVTSSISARVNGSARRLGLNARRVRGRWTGAVPAGYLLNGIVSIPILTPAAYTAIQKGSIVSYLGNDIRIVGKAPERVN